MELQNNIEAFARDGVALFAISYDEPDALAAFADTYGITFPLLSDPDSEIIRRFGILNTLIAEDDHPWFGIPFPGSYTTDADGVINGKFFEANLVFRANADELRRAALGEKITIAPASPASEVQVEASFDGTELPVGILRDLLVKFRVPEGQHLYGNPVPEGSVATSIVLDEVDGLVALEPKMPPTKPHVLAGTGETLQIFTGDVVVRIPITHNSRTLTEIKRDLRVSGTVHWQACDDQACHLPQSQRVALTIPMAPINSPWSKPPDGTRGMDFEHHMRRMVERRG